MTSERSRRGVAAEGVPERVLEVDAPEMVRARGEIVLQALDEARRLFGSSLSPDERANYSLAFANRVLDLVERVPSMVMVPIQEPGHQGGVSRAYGLLSRVDANTFVATCPALGLQAKAEDEVMACRGLAHLAVCWMRDVVRDAGGVMPASDRAAACGWWIAVGMTGDRRRVWAEVTGPGKIGCVAEAFLDFS